MSFLEKASEKAHLSIQRAEAAYQALACEDWAGAWLLLEPVAEGDVAHVLYNKGLCLFQAGRWEESRRFLSLALRALTAEPSAKKELDSVALSLLAQMGMQKLPPPMSGELVLSSPAYGVVLAQWAMALCLFACGREDEAQRTAGPLERYHLTALTKILNREVQ